jgi:RNA polymerase sigma-70 factor (ECF subfamily)
MMRGLGGLTDEQLMRACRDGRHDALEELYRRHHRAVFAFIVRLVQDHQLAEDLVQETFLRVFGSRKRWQPRSKFTSWLYRIARNLCIDEKRRYWNRLVQRDAEARIGDSSDSLSVIDLTEDKGFNARQRSSQRAHAEIIKQAVNSLSHDQREVIILNKYQGLSYIEIAEILGVTPESIKQRAYRAHLKLREILRPIMEEYE